MSNRDTFQRHTGPLQMARGTAPLRAPSRQLVDPAALRAQVEEMLGKGRVTLENMQPRIELLLRSCQAAKIGVPGVGAVPYAHALSPKGEQIIAYLGGAFSDATLVKEVQVAVYRYYDAERAIANTQQLLEDHKLEPERLEELKLKLFYLSRFHEVFKRDRVLTQLFPPPQTVEGGNAGAAPQKQLSTVERLKLKKQREEILRKADILVGSLAPRMPNLLAVLDQCENTGPLDIKGLLTSSTRTARLLALGIGTSPALVAQLKEARDMHAKLVADLEKAKAGGDVETLKETIYPLSRLAITCRTNPMLKDLFPANDDGLFPDESKPVPGTGPLVPPPAETTPPTSPETPPLA